MIATKDQLTGKTLIRWQRAFVPDAVFIPDSARWNDNEGEHVNPDDCIRLKVDGDNNHAEARDTNGKLWCQREDGQFEAVEGGVVELLPELWIVKMDETEYWCPEVQEQCSRIFGAYVFDRKYRVHLCSFTPTYELYFLGSQWEYKSEEISQEDRESLADWISEGDAQVDRWRYEDVSDVESMMETRLQEGEWPPKGKSAGGGPMGRIGSVTREDAIREVEEAYYQQEF